jgi:hypothetical protein
MEISNIKPIQARRSSPAGRYVLGALLLAALALAVFAADIQGALADVGIQANYNYVSNGSFETGGNPPSGWLAGALGAKDKRVCNQSKAGSCSFKMVGDGTDNYIYQVIPLTNTDPGNEFKLKLWTKGKALDLSGGGFQSVFVQFYNGATPGNFQVIHVPSGTSAWTMRQVNVTAVADYDKIYIFLELDANSGKVWFDKVTLVYVGGP